ncbi:MAG: Uma2 family endonuclease [Anaerolineae bacterium]|nr:Uma2 family endonuclease [Anaerolineae bacterium]
MVSQTNPIQAVRTAEEFDAFLAQFHTGDEIYEFIGGEIVEVPSNPYASEVGGTIFFFFKLFVREHAIAGHVTPADGGYWVSGERYAPDVAYISQERLPEPITKGYCPNPPNLAVEVVSDETSSEELNRLRWKITNYLAAETVAWVVFPVSQRVEVYVPGQPVQLLGIDDTLDGGTILPGFQLPVREIFK